jgi:hypothetical protein
MPLGDFFLFFVAVLLSMISVMGPHAFNIEWHKAASTVSHRQWFALNTMERKLGVVRGIWRNV